MATKNTHTKKKQKNHVLKQQNHSAKHVFLHQLLSTFKKTCLYIYSVKLIDWHTLYRRCWEQS